MNILQKPETVGRRAVNRHNNRAAILTAARQAFTELGFGATTVRDIIRRTDLASGTFYNYFDSKDQVFQALTEEVGDELRQQLRQARHQAADFESFVEASFFTYLKYFADHPETYFLLRSNRGRDGSNERMQGPQVKAGLSEMQADLQRAMDNGWLPHLDAAYLTAMVGGVAFSVLDEMMTRQPVDPGAASKLASQIFLAGVTSLK